MSAVHLITEHKGVPCAIADLSLAAWGRKELKIAESEMPALMAIREEYAPKQILKGARITGSLHMTIQTGVLVETLQALGADVRWASCNIFSTQDHAAAALVEAGTPVFAYKGESLEDYWDYTHRIFEFGPQGSAGEGPNMILDDGGDATMLMHLGKAAEKDQSVLANPGSEEERILFAAIKAKLAVDPTWYSRKGVEIIGVTEETTTGVHRLNEMSAKGTLMFRAINVNDSVTKSKFDNLYGCRESLVDGIKRATDVMVAGKVAVVAGYGDVGKGSAQSLRQEGMIVRIQEIDPICAMQACMDGYEVVSAYTNGINTGRFEDVNQQLLGETDLIVTTTGNTNVCDAAMLRALKNGAVVCNIGHFDTEIDTAWMRSNWRWEEVKPQVHKIYRAAPGSDVNPSDPNYLILLSEGRLVNLGNATGHPSRIMDGSFANQVLAQMYLFDQKFASHSDAVKARMLKVEVLPKKLDEEVAAAMVAGFGGVITQLTPAQADYIGVKVEGPFKPDAYKY